MITREIDYRVGGVRYVGSFFADETVSRRRPGVLVAPEGGGLADLDQIMPRLAPWFADPTGIREIAEAALGRPGSRMTAPPIEAPGRP
jgi:hypothetical protein